MNPSGLLPDREASTPTRATAYETVLRSLDARGCLIRPRAEGKVMAQCPAHDDRNPSLCVSEGKDGRALVNCFAGCSIETVVSALNLTMSDLFSGTPHEATGSCTTETSIETLDVIEAVLPYYAPVSVGQEMERRTALRCATLQAPRPNGPPGPCPLPGHSQHSAELRIDPDVDASNPWRLCCGLSGEQFTLAEVRASVAYGDAEQRPAVVEASRWAELLDYECGLLAVRPVPIIVPDDLSADAALLAEQVRLLIGLRGERWSYDRDRFAFTYRFARVRSGLGERRVRGAMRELRSRRVIVLAGKSDLMNLYRLGTEAEVWSTGRDEDAVRAEMRAAGIARIEERPG